MQELLQLQNSTVKSLVEGMNELANNAASVMKNKFIQTLKEQNIDQSILCSVSNIELSFRMSTLFENVKSNHLKKTI